MSATLTLPRLSGSAGWVTTEPPLTFTAPCPGCQEQACWVAVPVANGSTGYKRVDYTITCPTLECQP